MAPVPFHQLAAPPCRQRKEKQLVLAEWDVAEPGQWRRRTKEWDAPDDEEGNDDRSSDAPGPDQ